MIHEFLTFRLDGSRLELFEGADRLAVEPRVLEFLLYLVSNRERVVSKEELATDVWRSTFVSDAAIARCASEARRLLGDLARPHRIIETVYGRGYRFVALVESPAADSPATALPAPVAPDVESPTGFNPKDVAATADDTRTDRVRSKAAAGSWRGRVAVLGLLVAAVVSTAFFWVRKAEPVGPSASRPVAVTWRATDDTDGARLVGWTIADMVGQALGTSEGAFLVAPPSAQVDDSVPALAAHGRALGADGLLHVSARAGSVADTADLEIAWIDDLSETRAAAIVLVRHVLPTPGASQADLDRYVDVRSFVLRELSERLDLSLSAAKGLPWRPNNPEAWRLYLDAVVGWEVACDDRRAVDLLERSLELEPEFAPAWYLLSAAYLAQINLCGIGNEGYLPARRAAERASALAPEWPAPVQLLALFDLYAGETEAAYSHIVEATSRFPPSVFIRLRASEILRYAGFLERSREAFEQALELWPAAMALTDSVPYPYLYRGDWERFLGDLSGRGSPYFSYYRGWALWQSGRSEAAMVALESAFRKQPGDVFARLASALAAIIDGKQTEAVTVLERLIEQLAWSGSSDGEVTYKVAQLFLLADEPERALTQLTRAVRQGFACPVCIELDPVFSPRTSEPPWQRILEEAKTRHRSFAARFGLEPESVGVDGQT